MSKSEEGRPDLNRREKQAMEMLLVAISEMEHGSDTLKSRLKMIDRHGYAYYRMALGNFRKAINLIFETMPTRQLLQIQTIGRCGVITLNINRALLPTGYTPVSDVDMNVMAAAAVNNKCALCMLEPLECQSCQLRKTLMKLWPPKELNRYGRCPYQGARWAERPEDEEGEEI